MSDLSMKFLGTFRHVMAHCAMGLAPHAPVDGR